MIRRLTALGLLLEFVRCDLAAAVVRLKPRSQATSDWLRNHRPDKPKFTGHGQRTGGISPRYQAIRCGASPVIGQLAVRTTGPAMAIGGMMKKVLVSVVEDDPSFRESMCRLMRSLGYTVESFSSATEFLASPSVGKTACIIADIHMPGMTGLELYRHLTDMGHAIPTILVTAFPNDIDRVRALNDGVVCYLRKPVDEEHLIQCVSAALRLGEPSEPE